MSLPISLSKFTFIFKFYCFILSIACDQIHTSRSGIINSMNYPGNYVGNLNCKYLISTLSTPAYVISISFRDFDIQYSENCEDHVVSVFNGGTSSAPLLGSYCGTTKPPTLRSSSSKILIVLKSNAVATSKGFQLSYQRGNLKAILILQIMICILKSPTVGHVIHIDHVKLEMSILW